MAVSELHMLILAFVALIVLMIVLLLIIIKNTDKLREAGLLGKLDNCTLSVTNKTIAPNGTEIIEKQYHFESKSLKECFEYYQKVKEE